MSHEESEFQLWLRNPCRNVDTTQPIERDELVHFFEEVEPLERAGCLPDPRTRLRSEHGNNEEGHGNDGTVGDGDGDFLAKRAGQRRKIQIALFLKRSLAEGETIEGLIAHAAKHSLETATLMREVVDSGLLERIEAAAA